eukprot:12884890-Prorocentrum_lima.AAC.1
MKGKKPSKEVNMAQPVPADKFAETHTWIKRQIKGEDCFACTGEEVARVRTGTCVTVGQAEKL